jgi:hypothetical protein
MCYQIFLLGLPAWRTQLAVPFNLLVCVLLLVAWFNGSSRVEDARTAA